MCISLGRLCECGLRILKSNHCIIKELNIVGDPDIPNNIMGKILLKVEIYKQCKAHYVFTTKQFCSF